MKKGGRLVRTRNPEREHFGKQAPKARPKTGQKENRRRTRAAKGAKRSYR